MEELYEQTRATKALPDTESQGYANNVKTALCSKNVKQHCGKASFQLSAKPDKMSSKAELTLKVVWDCTTFWTPHPPLTSPSDWLSWNEIKLDRRAVRNARVKACIHTNTLFRFGTQWVITLDMRQTHLRMIGSWWVWGCGTSYVARR